MARLFKPTRPLLDAHGHPIIGPDGKARRVPRTANWYIRMYDANGKAHDIATGTAKKATAQQKLHDLESAKGKGEPIGASVGRVTFDDAATDIENDYKANGRRSLADVQRRLKLHLTPVFGGRRLTSITTADVRAFTATRLDAHASPAEINRELAILKRMFTLAVQAGKLLHRPHIPMLKERNVRTGFFERAEFEAVRAALPAHLRPVVTFAYLTGWRVMSEILTLRIGQVDADAEIVRLEAGTTKNDEPRSLHYGAITELRELLTDQVAAAERLSRARERVVSFVFHEPEGAPIDQHRLRMAWREACASAGYPGKLLHDFRRSAVRNLVRASIPERVAMMITGHKTRSVFDRYNIVAGSDLADAGRKLEAFLTGTPAEQARPTGKVRPFKRGAR